jgi:CTP synthase
MANPTRASRMIALVGDYAERHVAHRAIPRALELARAEAGAAVGWDWIPTRDLLDAPRQLAGYAGLWVVPASPYENTEGALAAIRWAREGGRPFLGTCGGFQHAILEFARNVAGIADADHAETNPTGRSLVVSPLSCSLAGQHGWITLAAGSRLAAAFGGGRVQGEYNCRYGFNPVYRDRLASAGLRFTAHDDAGEIRGAELPGEPFFCGVLFQPERAALRGEIPPPVRAFLGAVLAA